MSALEEIEAAIEKLTKLRNGSTIGPWKEPDEDTSEFPEDNGWWILNADEHGMNQHAIAVAVPYNPQAEMDARLIATLHRTIDAQLAILQDAVEMHPLWVEAEREEAFWISYGTLPLDLARAINGT